MGCNQICTVPIVHASTKKGAVTMTEGSCEFCTVLDTVSAARRVIPPFIVWKGRTHRDTYYKNGQQEGYRIVGIWMTSWGFSIYQTAYPYR